MDNRATKLQKAREFIVQQKIFFNRGYGLIGSLALGYLVASQLQAQLLAYYSFHCSLFVMYPTGVICVWLLGLIEYKLGFFHTEQDYNWKNTPQAKELSDNLRKKESKEK